MIVTEKLLYSSSFNSLKPSLTMILALPTPSPSAPRCFKKRSLQTKEYHFDETLKKQAEMFSWGFYISYFLSVSSQTTRFQQERVDLPFTPLTSLVFSL